MNDKKNHDDHQRDFDPNEWDGRSFIVNGDELAKSLGNQSWPLKKSHIEPVGGHKPPSRIRDTPKEVPYQVEDPEAVRERIERRIDDLTADAKPPKQKTKDKIMNAILTRIWVFIRDVILQWAFPFPIYKKGEDGVTPIRDENGKPVVDWFATVTARVMSFVAVAWGTVEVLGLPLAEWIARVATALGLPLS